MKLILKIKQNYTKLKSKILVTDVKFPEPNKRNKINLFYFKSKLNYFFLPGDWLIPINKRISSIKYGLPNA